MQSRIFSATLIASFVFCACASAQTQFLAVPQPQITHPVDESVAVTLAGNVHPLTAAAASSVTADLDTPMEHMVLSLKGSAAQEAALDRLLAAQNDPKSALYHHYLTPTSFAAQFGAAPADVAKVSAWLESHGMHIEQVPAGNRAVIFSGTAAQVNDTFQTEIRRYNVAGVGHLANATDPKVPAALAVSVGGVVKLHDFRHSPNVGKLISAVSPISPQYTNGSTHALTPADYGVIYDINPLYTAGINGTGQSIAVIARSDIYMNDVESFRNNFGLKANNPQFILTNSDPGVLEGDSVETSLDTEWSGAVAPNATIKVIISSSGVSDGVDLSSIYAVNNNVAPIITVSYGSCELGMGSSELSFYNSLWKQAASQGQSVMVSAGDSSAAGCDNPNSSTAQYGQNINGLCSSPYSTCVGGTEFKDTTDPGQYWLPTNNAALGSAISYIPEAVWNESGSVSGGSGLWGGGGGASIYFAKPSWQSGPGVPNDNKRDVPDLSMAAAGHDGYYIAYNGGYGTVGGTSAAAPSFAGIAALIDQKLNARQGLLNSTLYPLAVKQASGGAAVFHDITVGNNSVPGVTGFSAATGFDLASGLGTVDANLLVNHWTDGTTTANGLTLSASSTSLSVVIGQTGQTTITSTPGGSLKTAVAFTVSAPTGLTATLAAASIASPGSGADLLKVAALSNATPGNYSVTVTATGGGFTATQVIAVIVPAPSFTVAASASTLTLVPGNSGSVNISLTPQNGFGSVVALSVSGLPNGVTAAFTPASISGTGTSALKLTVSSNATASTATLTVTGTSGSLNQTAPVSLVVAVPALSIASSVPTLTVAKSSSASLTIASTQTALSSAVSLAVTGLPAGVTAAFSPATLSASGNSTLTFTAGSTVTAGAYALTVSATSGALTSKAAVSLVVPSASFTLATGATSVSVLQGNTGQTSVTVTPQSGFNSQISLSVTGAPAGVTAYFAPGTTSGVFTLTMAVATQTTAGSYPLTVTVTGGGITKTATVTLVVAALPACGLASNPATVSLRAGLSATAQLSCASPNGTFTGPLAITVTGAPSGMTAQLASSTLTPGTATVALNINTVVPLAGGTYNLAVNVSGSGFTHTLTVPVTVIGQNTITLTPSVGILYLKPGASGQVTLTTLAVGGFSSAMSFSAIVPASTTGVTATLSTASLPAPGSGTVLATINTASTTPTGNYTVQLRMTGGNCDGAMCDESVYLAVQVSNGADFSLAASPATQTIHLGSSGALTTSTGNYTGGFNGQMSVTITGLPYGTSYQVTGANAANNMVNITYGITTSNTTATGTYPVTITATGSGITHTAAVQVTISK